MSMQTNTSSLGQEQPDNSKTLTAARSERRDRKSLARQIIGRPLSVIAMVWITILVVLTAGAPLFASFSPTSQSLAQALQGPTMTHLLGTDQLGRDILARLLFGARVSLAGALIATVVAVALGSGVGLVAGYFRSGIELAAAGVADVLMSIPSIVILLSVSAVFARNQTILMVVLGILMSASVFRTVRASTLDVRGELYILAARTSGLGDWQIIGRHVLPRIAGLAVVQATIVASIALVTQVGLGFLGIDVVPPTPSWGNMVQDASASIGISLWQIVPPTVIVAVTVLAFSVLGDATQQALTGRGRRSGLGGSRARSRNTTGVPNSSSSLNGAKKQADYTAPLVVVTNLSVTAPSEAGQLTLVDRVSFEIRAGEVVGLVGESGAGKSVTARALLGLLPEGAGAIGSVRFDDNELVDKPEGELAKLRGTEIAFISQEPMVSLSPAFRVGHQLAEIVRTHRRTTRREAKRIALSLLEMVEIPDPQQTARKYPHEISGGMAQRVMIAIAMAGEPRLIVADEPTTALDVSVQMQVLELLRSLQRSRSLAVLVVTHDWGVVADLCERAIVMYAGQVVESADVREIIATPRHPYTSALRSADPHSQTRNSRLITIPGHVPQPDAWPVGCRFADRCRFAQDECRRGPISLTLIQPSHPVRCIRTQEIEVAVHE